MGSFKLILKGYGESYKGFPEGSFGAVLGVMVVFSSVQSLMPPIFFSYGVGPVGRGLVKGL